MLLSEGQFLVSQDMLISNITLTFPRNPPHINTILESELVSDVDPKIQTITHRLLLTDVVVFDDSTTIQQLPLSKRLGLLQTQFIEPRNRSPNSTTQDSVRVRLKTFSMTKNLNAVGTVIGNASALKNLKDKVLPHLPHGWEGLWFVSDGGKTSILEWSRSINEIEGAITYDELMAAIDKIS